MQIARAAQEKKSRQEQALSSLASLQLGGCSQGLPVLPPLPQGSAGLSPPPPPPLPPMQNGYGQYAPQQQTLASLQTTASLLALMKERGLQPPMHLGARCYSLMLPCRYSYRRALFVCICSKALPPWAWLVFSERNVLAWHQACARVLASCAAVLPLPFSRSCQPAARRSGAVVAAGAGVAAGEQRRECGGGAALRRHLGQRAKRAARAAPEPFKPEQRKRCALVLWSRRHCEPV